MTDRCRPLLRRAPVMAAAIAVSLAASLADADSPPAPNAVYLQPMTGLSDSEMQQFRAGETMFRSVWLSFPAVPLQSSWAFMRPPVGFAWGLGPTFVANSCAACHAQAGHAGTVDRRDGIVFQQLLRVSAPGEDEHGGPKPHPHYGHQLQPFDVISADRQHVRQGEAELFVDWLTEQVTLADGTQVELRRPRIRVEGLAFGPLGEETLTSLRNSRAIFGLGYLEAVSEKDILQLAAAQQAMGLNGRPNYVWDDEKQRISIGRFGWKANQPGLRQQVAAAFLHDMGVTSALYPKQNCPEVQTHCKASPPNDLVELFPEEFDSIVLWNLALDAPPQREPDDPQVRHGGRLFVQARCAQCHAPQMKTSANAPLPALANRTFEPYTDLLLHDMGDGLADGRPDFRAGPRDWRTSPLWGIGLSKQVNGSTNLLHDGRARNVTEAILWHGGEAKPARDAFARMTREERDALLAFVNSL